ncbi:MAG: ArnT family glycosyltransferase, partial [Fimbriimonadaceae bacterium]
LLTLCLTAAFTTFYDSLQGKPRLRYWTALWLGLAVLAKGPFGLAVFGLVMLWTLAREKELRSGFRGGWPLGLLILFGVIASWYVPAYLASGQVFIQEFLVEQNIGRLTGGDLAHRLPDWAWWAHPIYYPLVLLVGGAPWTWFGAAELFKPQERTALYRYLAAWALAIVILFTLSGSKLPHYGLPAIAPLVLLASRRLALAKPARWLRLGVAWAVAVGVIAQLGFYYAYHLDTTYHYSEAHRIARYLRNQPGEVALYRFGRQGPATPELGLERVATSMPSLLFYLQRPTIKADDPANAAEADWLFARTEAVDEETREGLRDEGLELVPVPEVETDNYVLYRIKR